MSGKTKSDEKSVVNLCMVSGVALEPAKPSQMPPRQLLDNFFIQGLFFSSSRGDGITNGKIMKNRSEKKTMRHMANGKELTGQK